MDRHQLVKALLASGVPPQSFQVPGVYTHDPVPTDFWFLRPGEGGGSEVGYYERGSYDVRKRFDSEADAAAWMYHAITGRQPPP